MNYSGRVVRGLGIILVCFLIAGCQTGRKDGDTGGFNYNPLNDDTNVVVNSGLPGSDDTRPRGGSATDPNGTAVLHAGDTIVVVFNDLNPAVTAIQDQIKEDGTITLYFNEKFVAAGKTVHALQEEIHDRYVPHYYKMMTPSITTADRYVFVEGEVRAPNRYTWSPNMTVSGAVALAGGFTDFSKKTAVVVTRAKTRKQEKENCTKAITHPELDLPVYPDDHVYVHKKLW